MKVGQEKHVRMCLKGCEAIIVTEILPVSRMLLSPCPGLFRSRRGTYQSLRCFFGGLKLQTAKERPASTDLFCWQCCTDWFWKPPKGDVRVQVFPSFTLEGACAGLCQGSGLCTPPAAFMLASLPAELEKIHPVRWIPSACGAKWVVYSPRTHCRILIALFWLSVPGRLFQPSRSHKAGDSSCGPRLQRFPL